MTTASAIAKPEQIHLTKRSPAYWRVTFDNPPINVMGPEMVREFQGIIDALEADQQVRVVVFDSAVDGYFLNHSDFTAKLEDLTSMPPGPTGLPPWPDFLVRLTRLPVASIAEHRLVWCRLSRPTDYRRSCQRTAPFGTSRAGSPVTGSRHRYTVRDRARSPAQAAVVALTGRGASAL